MKTKDLSLREQEEAERDQGDPEAEKVDDSAVVARGAICATTATKRVTLHENVLLRREGEMTEEVEMEDASFVMRRDTRR